MISEKKYHITKHRKALLPTKKRAVNLPHRQ